METKKTSKVLLYVSYTLQALIVAMLLMGAFSNISQSEMAVTGAVDMGYPENSVLYLGIVLLLIAILYAIPRTSFIGALLLTGWLGGAVATHVIHQDATLYLLFPVLFGILVWSSILLRNEALRSVILNNKKVE